MVRVLSVLTLTASVLAAFTRGDEPTESDLKKKPITTDTGEVGKLLSRWHKEGTAAGNVGDWYDNRDGEHSPLDLRPWPQLQKVKYTEGDFKARRNWALMKRTRDHVAFGNSSTSAPPELSGSNPRTAYVAPGGLAMLEKQYLGNNLYIYPEHRDHDPGHNGVGDGYGDLYPTNTPYLLISQGSSGSDQPFMRAVPFTLAAFRPDVKKKLVETGLLMPAVQMIFRASNKLVKEEKDYLTGAAHPSVFEGAHVDALKMVKLAHEITGDKIPPLVKLKVTNETAAEPGKDYFEPAGASEQHADTSGVIARVWRGAARSRTLVVSAADSLDVNKRPLTFTWVLLRGDERRVTITPKDKSGRAAEIRVEYHERRPIARGSGMESNRVDVGVFAHNGSYYSAPAFVTFYSLDSEARTYDDKGRPVEIGYGMGETDLKVIDHGKLFAALGEDGPAAAVLKLTKEQREELAKLSKPVTLAQAEVEDARKKRQDGENGRNKLAADLRQAEQALAKLKKDGKGEAAIKDATEAVAKAKDRQAAAQAEFTALTDRFVKAEKALNDALDVRRPAFAADARQFVALTLDAAAQKTGWWNDHLELFRERHDDKANAPRRQRVDAARKKLLDLGIVKDGENRALVFTPARSGSADRLTAFERQKVKEFNAVVLSELILPGLMTPVFRTNFVDARLTAPKAWRDVYRADGGWTRYAPGAKPAEFTSEGWLVVEKDAKHRPARARTVVYQQAPPKGTRWVNPNPLTHAAGDEVITFGYDGDVRAFVSRETVRRGE